MKTPIRFCAGSGITPFRTEQTHTMSVPCSPGSFPTFVSMLERSYRKAMLLVSSTTGAISSNSYPLQKGTEVQNAVWRADATGRLCRVERDGGQRSHAKDAGGERLRW